MEVGAALGSKNPSKFHLLGCTGVVLCTYLNWNSKTFFSADSRLFTRTSYPLILDIKVNEKNESFGWFMKARSFFDVPRRDRLLPLPTFYFQVDVLILLASSMFLQS
jgi:hypothetical protein